MSLFADAPLMQIVFLYDADIPNECRHTLYDSRKAELYWYLTCAMPDPERRRIRFRRQPA